ncbi:MAG: hypothetical protein ACR2J8_06980, partial [Thermomicrobiales bacterium]
MAPQAPDNLHALVPSAEQDFLAAGFSVPPDVIRRFVAGLLAKRFLVLSGQTGSGKTKLAQLFALWINAGSIQSADPFIPGAAIRSERVIYYVTAADTLSVEFLTKDEATPTKVTLPRDMIAEWADSIEANAFPRNTSPRAIRDLVTKSSQYSGQLHSFETHLKAAAFAFLDARRATTTTLPPAYRIVPIGADWASTEHVLGYPDA